MLRKIRQIHQGHIDGVNPRGLVSQAGFFPVGVGKEASILGRLNSFPSGCSVLW